MEGKTINKAATETQDAKDSVPNKLQELAHNLTFQCPDGTLVSHPTQCGDKNVLPNLELTQKS